MGYRAFQCGLRHDSKISNEFWKYCNESLSNKFLNAFITGHIVEVQIFFHLEITFCGAATELDWLLCGGDCCWRGADLFF